MLQVETTEAFDAWHLALDKLTRARIAARLVKLSAGLWGDCKSVGGGVTELREDFGPGSSFHQRYGDGKGEIRLETFSGDARLRLF